MNFLEEWLKSRGTNPDTLAKQFVKNDRWDRKYYSAMLDALEEFVIGHEQLCEHVETGAPMWADLFWLLWKVEPSTLGEGAMRPDHLINLLVGGELEDLPDFQKIRYFTEGDDAASALACVDMRETLETLFDKLKTLREHMQQVMDQMRALFQLTQEEHDIQEMIQRWEEGHNPDDEASKADAEMRQAALNQQIEELTDSIREGAESLEEEVDSAKPLIRQTLQRAVESAEGGAAAMQGQSELWGHEEGISSRMSAEERIKLAQRLKDGKLKHLMDFIGPMRRVMESNRMRPSSMALDEVVGVTLGNDLGRVLPSELAKIHHPLARYEFYRKYLERELPIYETTGQEKVGKGKIVACIDTSGSMYGEKEMWGKAVGITALHLARQQKRDFYGIHFASAREIREYDFGLDQEFSVERLMDYVEFNFWGGTDFMRPLSIALDKLEKDYSVTGKVNGDIIFITDGICDVDKSWLKRFKKKQEQLDFEVWSFLIGGMGHGPLDEICDGRVWEMKDLLDPNSTANMWASMGSK